MAEKYWYCMTCRNNCFLHQLFRGGVYRRRELETQHGCLDKWRTPTMWNENLENLSSKVFQGGCSGTCKPNSCTKRGHSLRLFVSVSFPEVWLWGSYIIFEKFFKLQGDQSWGWYKQHCINSFNLPPLKGGNSWSVTMLQYASKTFRLCWCSTQAHDQRRQFPVLSVNWRWFGYFGS